MLKLNLIRGQLVKIRDIDIEKVLAVDNLFYNLF